MGTSRREPDVRPRAMQRLLERVRPHEQRRLTSRELRTELVAAIACLLAGAALLVLLPATRPFSALPALALVGAYAAASRVRLFLGGGSAVLTQLVLVPMLFLAPVPAVPLLVAAALAGDAAVDVLRGRAHPERVLTATADAWYAVGAALVVALAGAPRAVTVAWTVMALALVAQGALDLLAATAREWIGRGIPPSLQVRVILIAFAIDASLTPLGVLLTAGSAGRPLELLAAVPLLGLLAVFAADRRDRIAEAVVRLDELQEERRRLDAAIRRIGEVCALRLERGPLLELAVQSAVEAVGGTAGRASAGGACVGSGRGRLPAGVAGAMAAAEEAARRCDGIRVVEVAGGSAMAHHLRATAAPGTEEVIAVAKDHGTFGEDERALFGNLATQIGIAMENVSLHERIAREATHDELTGLANHRRFQDVLRGEVQRSGRTGQPLALVMLDIDAFKAVNDRHGHLQGDAVLRSVASAVAATCRASDVAARYGGEELAVVAPNTDAQGAWALGEAIRRAVLRTGAPRPDGAPLRVTVSVGTAVLGPDRADPESLVSAADAALYTAKRTGKNRTVSDPRRPQPAAAAPEDATARRFASSGRGERRAAVPRGRD